MLFSKQEDYNPIDQYQPSSMTYGSGVPKHYQQSPQGFVNKQPRTRAEREYLKEQDQAHIPNYHPQQSSIFQSQQTPLKEDMKALLQTPQQNTTLFQSEQQRFYKDFAAEDKQKREMQNKLKQVQYEQRRLANLEREGLIWQRNEQYQMKDDLRRQYHAEQFSKGKRNANGLAYNPLTLEYAPTEQGMQLKRQDELSQVRQYARAQNIDQRANCGYNLLTGQNRNGVEGIVPMELKSDFQKKVSERDQQLNIKHYALQQQLLGKQYNE